MAIKCYFITPQKYKIPNLKNTKNRKGIKKERRFANIYSFWKIKKIKN